MLGCVVTDTDILIVTNYIKGCNLAVALGLVDVRNQQILDRKYDAFVLYTAAQGAAYIHERRIIHQDLKPANIMVEEPSKRAIICDLGLGKIKSNTATATKDGGNAGTLSYQHIEQLMGKPPTPSVDVYSFAVILLEVYTRTPAWNGFS
ncbi:serine/threonine-protein kinase pkn5-like [Acropora millepora]|uniref:serine/threonine-protein kinase pkn5-like n=1 Tax=Acropora millepora TaxID=45264 RepID=UPI001CF5BCDD|nr:serine/threonine-protein kinase pkn5-like [Acropora millepora]